MNRLRHTRHTRHISVFSVLTVLSVLLTLALSCGGLDGNPYDGNPGDDTGNVDTGDTGNDGDDPDDDPDPDTGDDGDDNDPDDPDPDDPPIITPPTTHQLTVIDGTGTGTYEVGTTVTITANPPPTDHVFRNWTSNPGVIFSDLNDPTAMFVMPPFAVTITANYRDTTTTSPPTTYSVTVNNGTGGGRYEAGTMVMIAAAEPPQDHEFSEWTSAPAVIFANKNDTATTFTMPSSAVTITANYRDTTTTTPPPTTYSVTVNSGTGGGRYEAGTMVMIAAAEPPQGHEFAEWTSDPAVTFANANETTTTFTMPENNVEVTANFILIPPPVTYSVTITGGTITGSNPPCPSCPSGHFTAGTTVTITAATPPENHDFWNWSADSDDITFSNDSSATATFIMPSNAVTITANFRAKPVLTYIGYYAASSSDEIVSEIFRLPPMPPPIVIKTDNDYGFDFEMEVDYELQGCRTFEHRISSSDGSYDHETPELGASDRVIVLAVQKGQYTVEVNARCAAPEPSPWSGWSTIQIQVTDP